MTTNLPAFDVTGRYDPRAAPHRAPPQTATWARSAATFATLRPPHLPFTPAYRLRIPVLRQHYLPCGALQPPFGVGGVRADQLD